ncbi:cobalamin-dependent protein [Marispirochaeta sp.]|jgi:5-methyltetrahydrofolate--homocysteine methyltransferase|uniref:cobalamin B12-binding domain-containing protein n=1 Tax=Marispirochaeta sp. TaxID=2038653 RepID=UPI0029C7D5B9|nr:cobalamin-dependent protein [Marispirochaeta sp.]
MNTEEMLEKIRNAIIMGHLDESDEGFDGDMEGEPGTVELVEEAIKTNVDAGDILTVFNEAMDVVGKKFEEEEYLLPDMLASAECVGEAMDIIEPHLLAGSGQKKGKFLIATVKGDLHDIGKNIVVTMLKGAGYEVKDLGIDVPAEKIINEVKEYKPDFLGLSALLTTTMVEMENVVHKLDEEGREGVKILIGGAPTSEEFARKIGADEHCRDAFEVIEKLKKYKKAG